MFSSLERRQAVAILEAYAPPRAEGAADAGELTSAAEGGDAKSESGEHPVAALCPRVGEVDYVDAMQRMMRAGTPKARLGIHLALWIVALAPLWMLVSVRTMAGLPIARRSQILERCLRHRAFVVRELALLLKVGASFALLGTASVRARSGYDRAREPAPPTRERRALPVLRARTSGAA